MDATTNPKMYGWLLAVLILISTPGAFAETMEARATAGGAAAASAFESFKSLAGEWRGSNKKGEAVTLRYELVGDGTTVLERLDVASEHPHSMATLYHLDGDQLMLTHYCAAGNQPRMRASKTSAEEVRFEFVDATGLESPQAGHMHRAVFRFAGNDRFSSTWTWHENGEDVFDAEIDVERVQPADSAPGR